MLNRDQGDVEIDGRESIASTGDGRSHAVFGPYVSLDAGCYVAEFRLARADDGVDDQDQLCAILDVAIDDGRTVVAHEFVFASQLDRRLRPILFRRPTRRHRAISRSTP